MADIIVKQLKEEPVAKEIGDFLTSADAFNHVWYPGEKEMVRKAVLDSLGNNKHQYWYVEDKGEVVAALGVRPNKCGGYEMDQDYVAVHQNYRKRGIASKLLGEMEQFVSKNEGRYIHILTCDIDSYKPAREFYEKNGYKRIGLMPNYYSEGEGRIDYYKEVLNG